MNPMETWGLVLYIISGCGAFALILIQRAGIANLKRQLEQRKQMDALANDIEYEGDDGARVIRREADILASDGVKVIGSYRRRPR